MMKKYFIALGVFFVVSVALGQSRLKIGDNPYMISSPSAVFELESGTRGFLPPRMIQASMTAITPTAVGLTVYCTNCTEGSGLYVNNGTSWIPTAFNATTSTKGVIQLAGDLTNTAASPTLIDTKVTGKALTNFAAATPTGAITATDTILSAFQKIEWNKTTSITSTSNTAAYPTAQAVKDYVLSEKGSGGTVEYVYATLSASITPAVGSAIPFNRALGNIALTNGVFSLKKDKTYRLEAYVVPDNSGSAGEINVRWKDIGAGTFISKESQSFSYVGGTNYHDGGFSAQSVYTPSSDTTIRLEVVKASGGTPLIYATKSSAIVSQIGTTASSQFVGVLSNDWNQANSYPSGTIVVKDSMLYQANAAIPANTPFTTGTSGTTWKLLSQQLASDMVKLYGKAYSTASGDIANASGYSFTVPISGRYLFDFSSTFFASGANFTCSFYVRQGTTNLGSDTQTSFSNTAHAEYNGKVEVNLVAGTTYNVYVTGNRDANDYDRVYYKQVAGFLPVTYNLNNITVNKSLTGLIPALTGYSGTSNGVTYTVSASTQFDTNTYNAWRCMQTTSSAANCWITSNQATNFWLQVQMSQPQRIWRVDLLGRTATERPLMSVIQGSNDGTNWYTISSLIGDLDPTSITGTTPKLEVATDYLVAYSYIRFYCFKASGTNPGLLRFQMYGAN